MLARKGDPTCVKMIDFGLSKDFSGQETMKTMSGSVSETTYSNQSSSLFPLSTAILHRTRGLSAELQLKDWYLVARSRPLHHAVGKSSLSWQLWAWDYRKCHQGWLPFQSWAFLTTLAWGQGVLAVPHQEGCLAKVYSGSGLPASLDPELFLPVPADNERRDLLEYVHHC